MRPAWHTPERAAPKQAATILSITFTAYERTCKIMSISGEHILVSDAICYDSARLGPTDVS